MSGPARFEMRAARSDDGMAINMEEARNGEWIRYDDYVDDMDGVRSEVDHANAETTKVNAEVEDLKSNLRAVESELAQLKGE